MSWVESLLRRPMIHVVLLLKPTMITPSIEGESEDGIEMVWEEGEVTLEEV